MDYAKLDRWKARTGFAEVVYCSNKADEHLLNIYERLYQEEGQVLIRGTFLEGLTLDNT